MDPRRPPIVLEAHTLARIEREAYRVGFVAGAAVGGAIAALVSWLLFA
ncbi:MAG TPA: hypothetical protein VG873_18350 [Burkholderiales bacterium]|nr:hypothetical protein [Burkholderiales bacterium]